MGEGAPPSWKPAQSRSKTRCPEAPGHQAPMGPSKEQAERRNQSWEGHHLEPACCSSCSKVGRQGWLHGAPGSPSLLPRDLAPTCGGEGEESWGASSPAATCTTQGHSPQQLSRKEQGQPLPWPAQPCCKALTGRAQLLSCATPGRRVTSHYESDIGAKPRPEPRVSEPRDSLGGIHEGISSWGLWDRCKPSFIGV